MENKLFIALLWGLFFGHLFSINAQTKPALRNISGTISAVNAQAGEITVITDKKSTFIVKAADKTEMKQIPASGTDVLKPIKLDFIEAGETVLVSGYLSAEKTIIARQIVVIKNRTLKLRNGRKSRNQSLEKNERHHDIKDWQEKNRKLL